MTILLGFVWFIEAVLILLTLAGVVCLLKVILDIVRHNLDEGVSIWFKALQMNESIKDKTQEREIQQDKAELMLELVRQELRLKSGLSTFSIAGLEAEKGNAQKETE